MGLPCAWTLWCFAQKNKRVCNLSLFLYYIQLIAVSQWFVIYLHMLCSAKCGQLAASKFIQIVLFKRKQAGWLKACSSQRVANCENKNTIQKSASVSLSRTPQKLHNLLLFNFVASGFCFFVCFVLFCFLYFILPFTIPFFVNRSGFFLRLFIFDFTTVPFFFHSFFYTMKWYASKTVWL